MASVDVVVRPGRLVYSQSTAITALSAIVGRTGFVVTVTVPIVQMATDSFSPRLIGVWLRDGMRRAMAMCIAAGLLLVYALQSTGVAGTTKHALTPAGDLVLAAAALVVAYVSCHRRGCTVSRAIARSPG